MQDLETAVRHHLQDVLGLPTGAAQPWVKGTELPYFLQSALRFSQLDLLGQPVVLAIPQSDQRHTPGEIRQRLDKVRAVAGHPVLYVAEAMASYERKRLIEQRVPFIVPGNQLYLPDLGLDLREYFLQRAPAADTALSPSTQALLIAVLLRTPWQVEWQPAATGDALGYTAMTVSRAARELTGAGLATAYKVARARWLRMKFSPRDTWMQAKSRMKTPVKRTVWVSGDAGEGAQLRLAGLSALSRYSMLAEPAQPTYAIGPADWKAATERGVQVVPEPLPGTQAWQLWTYNPALPSSENTVDLLSLILSLQGDADDRVRMALDELEARLSW